MSSLKAGSKGHTCILLLMVFFAASLFQFARWSGLDNMDIAMWGNEAQSLQYGGPGEFDFLGGDGHPGGPILEGTIFLHDMFGLPYANAGVTLCVTLLAGLTITASCALCYMLRKNMAWCAAVFVLLSLNWLYQYSTPPSTLAAVLVVLFTLMTLYIYEHQALLPRHAALWGAVAGATVATRADIGAFCAVIFFLFLILSKKISLRLAGLLVAVSALAFMLLDPFMWFMPLQHLKDLVHKATYHYEEYSQVHIGVVSLLHVSTLAFISIALCLFFVFMRKTVPPVPRSLLLVLIGMTVALYAIFLTAHSQAERYFLPIIFVWEVFLPLVLFSLSKELSQNYSRTKQALLLYETEFSVVALLLGYELFFSIIDFFRFFP